MPYAAILALVALPALLAGGIWIWRRPAGILGAYFAVLPFGSAVALPVGLPRSFSTISSLLGALVGLVYLWRWLSQAPRLSIPSTTVPMWLLYLGLAAASVGWSIRPGVTVASVQVLGVLVGLFVVVVVTPITRSELSEIKAWIAGGAAVTGLYALMLAITGTLPTTGAGLPRFEITGGGGGEGGDPNITAAALVVPIAIALAETLDHRRRRSARVLYGAATVLAGAAVLLTASRGGMLAIAVAGLVILFTHRRGIGSMIVLALATLPALLLIPSTFAERADNTGTTGRSAIWRLAIESCPQYCPTGSGFGTFGDVHEAAFLVSESATGTNLRYQAHSIWFESLIEVGVLGLIVLVVALALLIRDLVRIRPSDRAGALAGLAGILVANTFLSNLTFKYFWLGVTYAVLVVAVEAPRSSRSLSDLSLSDSGRL